VKRHAELTAGAEADLAEAFDHYEGQLSGLGHELVTTLEQQLERVVMRRFPYSIFYLVEGDAVIVLAVEHQARDPEHWKQRL
jgi:hypothetical protein